MAVDNVVEMNLEYIKTHNRAAKEFMETDLARSGLKPGDLGAYPVEHRRRKGVPAYLLPYGTTDYWRIRCDTAKTGLSKYIGPYQGGYEIYFPQGVSRDAFRAANTKFVCEGEKKAAAFWKRYKIPVVAIGGCWLWGHKHEGKQVLLPDLQNNLKGGIDTVIYICDRDVLEEKKLQVAQACKALRLALTSHNVEWKCLLPPAPHKGIDDWLVSVSGRPNLEEELEAMDIMDLNWWPVAYLQDCGVTFNLPKEGAPGIKQMVSNSVNTPILLDMLLVNDKTVSADKYRGVLIGNEPSEEREVASHYKSYLHLAFPFYKPEKEDLWYYTTRTLKTQAKGNCIADYIQALTWDGERRLERWLPNTLCLEKGVDLDYYGRVGMMLICGMCARIMRPGTRLDHMFVLTGQQGIGKSTFMQTLGNFPDYDGHRSLTIEECVGAINPTIGAKLREAVVLDIDDLEHIRGREMGQIRSFITATHDNWRGLYKGIGYHEPRGCILVASTNDSQFLSDNKGNRRYLVIPVDDIRGVKGQWAWREALRDQLLAEAYARRNEIGVSEWYNLITVDRINEVNRRYDAPDPVRDAIHDMLTNDKCLKIKGTQYVSCTSVRKWLGEPQDLSDKVMGWRLSAMVNSDSTPFVLTQRRQIRYDLDRSDAIENLYLTPSKSGQLWVYPVKLRD